MNVHRENSLNAVDALIPWISLPTRPRVPAPVVIAGPEGTRNPPSWSAPRSYWIRMMISGEGRDDTVTAMAAIGMESLAPRRITNSILSTSWM